MSPLNRREFVIGATLLSSGVSAAVASQAHCTLIMMYDPAQGQKPAFDAWWPEHLKSMSTVRGVAAAGAYQRSDVQVRAGAVLPLPRYAAVYAIEAKDTAAVVKSLGKRLSEGKVSLAPIDHASAQSFAYERAREWSSKSTGSAPNQFLQLVFANPVPGREDEFAQWYDQTHARELLAVPGITEIERSLKSETCPIECSPSPKSLSALHIKAPSIEEFKVGLERVAKTFTDTTSYDIANAWRLTLQKIG